VVKGLAYDMREDTPGKLLEEIGRARSDPKIMLNMAVRPINEATWTPPSHSVRRPS